jgi:hypothetical protein
MGFSTEPIRQIGWFERSPDLPFLNHQPINSDGLEGAIRNPIQQEEVVGRAFSGPVCSLPFDWLTARRSGSHLEVLDRRRNPQVFGEEHRGLGDWDGGDFSPNQRNTAGA